MKSVWQEHHGKRSPPAVCQCTVDRFPDHSLLSPPRCQQESLSKHTHTHTVTSYSPVLQQHCIITCELNCGKVSDWLTDVTQTLLVELHALVLLQADAVHAQTQTFRDGMRAAVHRRQQMRTDATLMKQRWRWNRHALRFIFCLLVCSQELHENTWWSYWFIMNNCKNNINLRRWGAHEEEWKWASQKDRWRSGRTERH